MLDVMVDKLYRPYRRDIIQQTGYGRRAPTVSQQAFKRLLLSRLGDRDPSRVLYDGIPGAVDDLVYDLRNTFKSEVSPLASSFGMLCVLERHGFRGYTTEDIGAFMEAACTLGGAERQRLEILLKTHPSDHWFLRNTLDSHGASGFSSCLLCRFCDHHGWDCTRRPTEQRSIEISLNCFTFTMEFATVHYTALPLSLGMAFRGPVMDGGLHVLWDLCVLMFGIFGYTLEDMRTMLRTMGVGPFFKWMHARAVEARAHYGVL